RAGPRGDQRDGGRHIDLHQVWLVPDVHRLQVRVDVESFGARLAPAIAGLTQAAEGHMWLGAIGWPVDRPDAAAHADQELLGSMDRGRPDSGREPVLGRVRRLDGLVEPRNPMECRNWPEELRAGEVRVERGVLDESRSDVVAPVIALAGEP